VSPESAVTENLREPLVPTSKSPVESSVPVTPTPVGSIVSTVGEVPVPMAAPLICRSSTCTYWLLEMVNPVVPEWVIWAASADRVTTPGTVTPVSARVSTAGTVDVPMFKPLNLTLSTPTHPLVLEIDSPFPAPAAAVCVSAAVALVTVIPPDRAASTNSVAPVVVNVPSTVTPVSTSWSRSALTAVPTLAAVCLTFSTSTHPWVLEIDSPVPAPGIVCVSAAVALVIVTVSPATSSAPANVVPPPAANVAAVVPAGISLISLLDADITSTAEFVETTSAGVLPSTGPVWERELAAEVNDNRLLLLLLPALSSPSLPSSPSQPLVQAVFQPPPP